MGPRVVAGRWVTPPPRNVENLYISNIGRRDATSACGDPSKRCFARACLGCCVRSLQRVDKDDCDTRHAWQVAGVGGGRGQWKQ